MNIKKIATVIGVLVIVYLLVGVTFYLKGNAKVGYNTSSAMQWNGESSSRPDEGYSGGGAPGYSGPTAGVIVNWGWRGADGR